MTISALRIKNLNVHYTTGQALQAVSLNIPLGSRTAIVGPNGAGKSTLFKSILGLQSHQVDELEILGQQQDLSKLIKQQVAYIPQVASVNWQFPASVFDIVMMGRYPHSQDWLKRPNQTDQAIVLESLETMQLLDLQDRQIHQLSGGQRQRVFIARALAQKAQLYLMDEPLAGIDSQTEEIIMSTLQGFQAQGKTAIVIHHDFHTLARYFDEMVWLNQTVIAAGPISQTLTPDNYAQTYRTQANPYFTSLGGLE